MSVGGSAAREGSLVMGRRQDVAIVHDYLTQRGGAERTVLAIAEAFPFAPIHTSLYEPGSTFPEFADRDVRPMPLNRVAALRSDHRRALPLLAPAFARLRVEAEVTVCSSSGWAHGARATGRKIVYCYNPARWLYQADHYLPGHSRLRGFVARRLRPPLIRWDQRSARTADRYLAISRAVRDRIRDVYGIEAEVLHPPHAADPDAERRPLAGVEPGYWLTVSRLLSYKHVDAILAAFEGLPARRLVVVGVGPDEQRLRATAPPNATLLGMVADAELRWLYANCAGLAAASYEDFGLTPLEAAAFGRPTVAIRFGGYLDTIVDGLTGVLVDSPSPAVLRAGIMQLERLQPDPAKLAEHASAFARPSFMKRISEHVRELAR